MSSVETLSQPASSREILAVAVAQSADGWSIRLTGELDLSTTGLLVSALRETEFVPAEDATIDLKSTTGLLRRALKEAESIPAEGVTIDLRDLEFIDSTGIEALLRASQRAQEDGRRFDVVGADGAVARLLNIVGLDGQPPFVEAGERLTT